MTAGGRHARHARVVGKPPDMAMPLPNVWRVDHEPASYLGCRLEISAATVRVFSPDGRLLDRVRTLSAARRIVRAYRNFGRSN